MGDPVQSVLDQFGGSLSTAENKNNMLQRDPDNNAKANKMKIEELEKTNTVLTNKVNHMQSTILQIAGAIQTQIEVAHQAELERDAKDAKTCSGLAGEVAKKLGPLRQTLVDLQP